MTLVTEACDTTPDFVSALRPDASLRDQLRGLVYRGHEDASWKLVPTAFRASTRFPTEYGWLTVDQFKRRWDSLPGMSSEWSFYEAMLEFETLRAFFQASDDAGLPLPEDSQLIRDQLKRHRTSGWPDRPLLSILALAQHHGLPTRLLDWTRDWRVAAFFAASDNLRKELSKRATLLAVWSLDTDDLRFQELPGLGLQSTEAKRPFRLHLVTAPAATNLNLRAQKGLFTTLEVLDKASGVEPSTPLDDLARLDAPGRLKLIKYTLPTSEAPMLLHQLALEGLTAATVFPGYGGVVQSLKDRNLWAPMRER